MTRVVLAIILVLGATGVAIQAVPDGAASSPPTFTKDVAPILFSHCASCHRPGEIGPMSLTSFEDARPWARAIRDKVVRREMPPWGADPKYGKFRNDRSLTSDEIDTIAAWVDGGSPRGRDSDLPPAPLFESEWQLGEPDYVIEMPVEFDLPAEGQIELQDFFVPVPFAEDRFVEALEIRPTTTGVLHHGGAYVVDLPPGTRIVNGRGVGPNGRPITREEIRGVGESAFETQGASKLISFVPGRGAERHRPGVAKRIPAGKFIHFDMHYEPSGRAEKDRTALGLWFSKAPVIREVLTRSVTLPTIVDGRPVRFETFHVGGEPRLTALIPNIPPYVDNWQMVTIMPFTSATTLYALSPHMHLRGKDMTYIVTYPNGIDEIVLRVPKYDFHWQIHYELETPLRIPAGSKMTAIAHFDNSLKNRYNPAPEKLVYWSVQSWDEMNVPMLELSFDDQPVHLVPPHR